MNWMYNDGGRSNYYKASNVGDCVTRAIAIAAGMDYKEVYQALKKISGQSPRDGVHKKFYKKYIEEELGWKWHACMGVGTGCKTHLTEDELPSGRIICRLSRHLVAVIDGTVHDTYDCTRDDNRCVYGYWYK